MTIQDYFQKVQELRELGQRLVQEQYCECDEPAEWVDELECMDLHFECCVHALMDAGVEG